MKKNNQRPSLSKFRIAKLNRPDYIVGGGSPGDDGTVSDGDKDKCKMKSKVIV